MTYPITMHFCDRMGIIIVFLNSEEAVPWSLEPIHGLRPLTEEELEIEQENIMRFNDNVFTSLSSAFDYLLAQEAKI